MSKKLTKAEGKKKKAINQRAESDWIDKIKPRHLKWKGMVMTKDEITNAIHDLLKEPKDGQDKI